MVYHPLLPPIKTTVVGILACAHLCLAEFVADDSSEHYGSDPPNAPLGITSDKWHELFAQGINATGEYPLTAAPSTSNSSTDGDGWTWRIEVKADIDLQDASAWSLDDLDDQELRYVTGSQITLEAPQQGVDADWGVCLLQWHMPYDYSDGLRDHPDRDDGTCSSVLSDQCISDLQKGMSDTWLSLGCSCPDITTIDSCKPVPESFSSGCSGTYMNSTLINNGTTNDTAGVTDWKGQQYVAEQYAGSPGARGDIAVYNETGSRPWPFLVAWVKHDGSSPESQLTCIRATEAVGNSQVPGPNVTRSEADDDTSDAPGLSSLVTSNAVLVGFIASLSMLL
ncbi:hypothetical protein G7054_g2692 [Neopestalotiopsis clavispora]|nr:hypothetical protein G7054_g2692 [Neopestalotiopsis clavispora]